MLLRNYDEIILVILVIIRGGKVDENTLSN
jgi:hypothetical protein